MFFGTPEHPWLFVAMFLIANLNYELVQSFYNAFLPEIADDESMSRGLGLGIWHRLRRRRADAGRWRIVRAQAIGESWGSADRELTFCRGCAC